MALRDRVIQRSEELGLKPYHLSQRLGHKGNSVVWSLLNGRTQTFRDMPALARALETTLEWLLTDEDTPKARVADRPHAEPDPKYMQILKICLRVWQTAPYDRLDEMTILDIVRTLYEETETVKESKIIAQASSIMAYQLKMGKYK